MHLFYYLFRAPEKHKQMDIEAFVSPWCFREHFIAFVLVSTYSHHHFIVVGLLHVLTVFCILLMDNTFWTALAETANKNEVKPRVIINDKLHLILDSLG